jgi:hypothetical protein
MTKKYLKKITFLLFSIVPTICFSQHNIISAGGTVKTNTYEISDSIGQTFINVFNNETSTVTEGLQFNYTLLSLSNNQNQIVLTLYPNPTERLLNINFKDDNKLPLNYNITDINGKIIYKGIFTDFKNKLDLEVSNALYFLNIYKKNTYLNTYKILKN